MSDELDTLSDAQLNDIFAVEVLGLRKHNLRKLAGRGGESVEVWITTPPTVKPAMTDVRYVVGHDPDYCTDANAVLPWLQKCNRWKADQCSPDGVWVEVDAPTFGQGYSETFARAAVIALLRAKRAKTANA